MSFFEQFMGEFLLGLYLVAFGAQFFMLVRSLIKGDRRLWCKEFIFAAIMCFIAFSLFGLYSNLEKGSPELDAMFSLKYFKEILFSFFSGIGYAGVWIVSVLAGLIRFKGEAANRNAAKKEERPAPTPIPGRSIRDLANSVSDLDESK